MIAPWLVKKSGPFTSCQHCNSHIRQFYENSREIHEHKIFIFGDFLFDSHNWTKSEAWLAYPVLKSEKITGVRLRKEFSEINLE